MRNCSKYPAEKKAEKAAQGKYDLLVVETYLVEYDTSTWILDSGATNHICFSFQESCSWKKLVEHETTLKVGMREVVSVEPVRDLKMFLEDRYLLLKNILYVPQIKRNLTSIPCILEHMYEISFEINETFIFSKGIQICSTILENNL